MWDMVWPMMVIIVSNVTYNVCAKLANAEINAFASLMLTYGVALLCAAGMFFATSPQRDLLAQLKQANWASYLLGVAIVGLEFGFISAYRAGWLVSNTQLFASVGVACVLVVVGAALFHDVVSATQVVGMAVCAVGMYLMVR